jgi:chromosome segregation ATPase
MNKDMIRNITLVLLAAITIFCVIKYFSVLKEKYDIQLVAEQLKQQVTGLEAQKEELSRQLKAAKDNELRIAAKMDGLKEYLEASKRRMAKLFTDLQESQKSIDDLDSKIALLKSENEALRTEKQSLVQDNESLKVKLNSIAELKKAMKELRGQINNVSKEIKKTIREEKLIEGNRGFLVKEGKPTYPAKVRIEVTPVPQSR